MSHISNCLSTSFQRSASCKIYTITFLHAFVIVHDRLLFHLLSMFLVGLQIFTFSQKASANFQLIVRLLQGVIFLAVLAGVTVAIVLTDLTVGDVFASSLAFIPTGWGLLSVRTFLYVLFEWQHDLDVLFLHSFMELFQHVLNAKLLLFAMILNLSRVGICQCDKILATTGGIYWAPMLMLRFFGSQKCRSLKTTKLTSPIMLIISLEWWTNL